MKNSGFQDQIDDIKENFIDVGEDLLDAGADIADSFKSAFGYGGRRSRKSKRKSGIAKSDSKTSFVQLKCPACGAVLGNINAIKPGKCTFCGANLLLDNNARIAAEVELKELENKKYMFDKREQRRKEKRKTSIIMAVSFIIVGMGIPLLILGIGSYMDHKKVIRLEEIEQQVEEYYIAGNYDAALLKANQLVYDGSWSDSEGEKWDEKRENLIKVIEQAMKKKGE